MGSQERIMDRSFGGIKCMPQLILGFSDEDLDDLGKRHDLKMFSFSPFARDRLLQHTLVIPGKNVSKVLLEEATRVEKLNRSSSFDEFRDQRILGFSEVGRCQHFIERSETIITLWYCAKLE